MASQVRARRVETDKEPNRVRSRCFSQEISQGRHTPLTAHPIVTSCELDANGMPHFPILVHTRDRAERPSAFKEGNLE